jgi:hypothetical protein
LRGKKHRDQSGNHNEAHEKSAYRLGRGEHTPVRIGRVKQFAIGDFEIRDADISFVDLKKADQPSAHLLGIGELVVNSAIIDVGGLAMYLRHPE